MSDAVRCFLLEPTVKFKRNLRRFVFSDKHAIPCKDKWYHNAVAYTQDIVEMPNCKWAGTGCEPFPHDDPRWPKACEHCGYVFVETDEWQHNLKRVWRRSGTSDEYIIRDAPPGAMWYFEGEHAFSPTGVDLYVKLPDGREWNINDPRKLWTWTGVPPIVTARPSILTPGYHGFLTDGVLRAC